MSSHEIWAAAQLLPGEGIEDGVRRIDDILNESKSLTVDRIYESILEKLSEIEHDRWSGQAKTALTDMTDERRERWGRLVNIPYCELSEEMKALDRMQVDEYWPIIAKAIHAALPTQDGGFWGRTASRLSKQNDEKDRRIEEIEKTGFDLYNQNKRFVADYTELLVKKSKLESKIARAIEELKSVDDLQPVYVSIAYDKILNGIKILEAEDE